jgi:hypothetical protein
MPRLRNSLVIAASVLLIASSGAHSLLGWPALRAKLDAASVPADLVQGLAMGWHFAGLVMLVLGIVTLWLLRVERHHGANVRLPLFVIGGAYELFGIGCLVLLGWDPFLLTFLVPGALLSAAAALTPVHPASVASAYSAERRA